MNKLRKIAASIGVAFVAFTPLLITTPAYAQSLEEAQAALAAGQQEVIDATRNKQLADEAVASTSATLTANTADAVAAEADYTASAVVTTITSSEIVANCYNRLGFNNAPPLPTDSESPIATQTVANIDFQWGGGVVLNCGRSEDVLLKFTGTLMVPATGDYQFYAPADDGTKFTIAGVELISDWWDKGGGGTISQPINLAAGVLHPFTFYFYENGGGANVQLQWMAPSSSWQVVPASAFGGTSTVTTYDPELLVIWENKQASVVTAQAAYDAALAEQVAAESRLQAALAAIAGLEQAVVDATPPPPPPVDPNPPVPPVDPVPVDPTPVDPLPVDPPVEPVDPVDPVVPDPTDPGQGSVEEPTPPVETPETTPEPVEPQPQPSIPEPEIPSVTPEPPVEEPTAVVTELLEVAPESLTEAQVEQLVEAAMEVFATAEQGSEEYQQALEALAVAAQADDPEVPAELAAIPLLGDAAAAVLNVFNDIGNVGADMAPQVREAAEKTIIASVIAAQAAVGAVSTATAAASAASSVRRN